MITTVEITENAEKSLNKLPHYIVTKFRAWVRIVRLEGLENVRLIKGYHDEPLKGSRKGQRSIRLNISYRAIYSVMEGKVKIVFVEEVNKHEY